MAPYYIWKRDAAWHCIHCRHYLISQWIEMNNFILLFNGEERKCGLIQPFSECLLLCPEHWFLSMSVWFKTHTVQVSSCKVKICPQHRCIHYFPFSHVCLRHRFCQKRCNKKHPDIACFTVFRMKLPLSRLHHFHFPSPAGSRLFPELSSVGHTEEKSAVGICCVSDSGRGSGAVARLSGRSALCSL